ncbi:hypothetical protein [Jannaschia formosa]|uniref:hypothetical protein n=1 Tax=Jannaschia formosa TaxID=2259592 RepID=UPI00143036A6|nr:hypothetical protein [Jannaschia formosa]
MQMTGSEAKVTPSEPIAAERGDEPVSLGALEGVVPASSVPDFLEKMPEDERRSWGA